MALDKVDSAYELYAGGRKLGGVGELPPRPRPEYDRHATFVVPRDALDERGRLVLAVRVWKAPITTRWGGGLVEGGFLLGPLDALTRREAVSEITEVSLALVFVLVGALPHAALPPPTGAARVLLVRRDGDHRRASTPSCARSGDSRCRWASRR